MTLPPARRLAAPSALGLLILLAAWPLLRLGMPTGGDGLTHYYRVLELDWSIRHGNLLPRWLPDVGYGYGMPIYVFYPLLANYLAESIHLLGLGLRHSVWAAYLAAPALAAVGMYLWTRELLGRPAGLLAAAAYVLAPYFYFDLLARAALSEALALGLAPWIFWAYHRLHAAPTAGRFLAAALLYAALVLTHVLSAAFLTPVLIIYLWAVPRPHASAASAQNLDRRSVTAQPAVRNRAYNSEVGTLKGIFDLRRLGTSPRRRTSLSLPATLRSAPVGSVAGQEEAEQLRSAFIIHPRLPGVHRSSFIIGSFALALVLTAFWWFPGLYETRWVRGLPEGGGLDYRNNFLSPAELFSLPRPFDPQQIFFRYPISLPWPQIGLAIVAAIGALSRPPRRTSRRLWLSLLVVLAGLMVGMLPVSLRFWEALPLSFARLVQFPWRLMGPATLLLALLAAQGVSTIGHWSLAHWSLIIVIWAYSLPWSFVSGHEPLAGEQTPADVPKYEIATGQIGATSAGEYLPVWVRKLPPADSLLPLYAASSVIRRFDEASLPPGASLLEQADGLTRAEVTFDSPTEFTARFNFLYYPGWRAALDGRPATIRISYPTGLITVQAPAGRHTLRVGFGSTPDRVWAGAASLAGVVIAAAIAGRSRQASGVSRQSQFAIRNSSMLWGSALVAAALLLTRIRLIDERETVFARTRFDGERVAGVQTPLDVNFGDRFALLGLDVDSPAVSGQTLDFTLYWRALRSADADYSISAQLLDEAGDRFGQQDSQHPGGFPTRRWPVDGYAADLHALPILAGAPPGTYRLVVGVYRPDTGAALSVLDANGIPQGNAYVAAEVVVSRPARPPLIENLGIQTFAGLRFGPLELIGYNFAGGTVGPGDKLPVTLFWRAAEEPAPLTARLALVNSSGDVIAQSDLPPARPDYPTEMWAQGEIIRAALALPIPAGAPPGRATLTLNVLDGGASPLAPSFPLGEIVVQAPPRQTVLPDLANPLYANFGGSIALLGYEARATGTVAPTVTLYWRSISPTAHNYTVFAHLLDAEGRVVAQSDSPPIGGARPTSGWLPGEVLADIHTLAAETPLPRGTYTLEVGLYDPASGVRLPVIGADGQPVADHVILGQIEHAGP